MALNRQLEDLCAVYAEKSEPELLALYEQREDLTEIAQEALTQVMRERRIAAPHVMSEPVEPQDEERIQQAALAADDVCIYTFDDAFQLREALNLLEQQDIGCRMVNWDELAPIQGDARPRMRLGLIVKRQDAATAKQILQQAMNLFPPAEGDDTFDISDALGQVGTFARADALVVAHALGSAGVSYRWNDSRDDETLAEDEVLIETGTDLQDEAHQIAQQALAQLS